MPTFVAGILAGILGNLGGNLATTPARERIAELLARARRPHPLGGPRFRAHDPQTAPPRELLTPPVGGPPMAAAPPTPADELARRLVAWRGE